MSELLFPSSPELTGALRAGARAQAVGFAQECRAIAGMFEAATAEQREFVHGEVACVLHLAPVTAAGRLSTALAVMGQPRLVRALETGRLGVGHALAVLSEVEHLEPAQAAAVLDAVLGETDRDQELELTPGELRSAVKRAILLVDADAARKRHEKAKQTAGVRGRPGLDGMGQVIIDCTAVQMATALAALRGRAAALPVDDPELTVGQRQVAAFLHALGCERTSVQAVLECPVERATDAHAAAGAAGWPVDVRMPVAVALGLSDHPAVLAGYGPIGAEEARALLPAADLVRACVDARTGQVLTVDPPLRKAAWQHPTGQPAPAPPQARALRQALLTMATSGGTLIDLGTDGYVPSEALGRLVDLRDVTSTFPGDSRAARHCDRDHRQPWPLGRTEPENLQNISKHWHRAKHNGWHTQLHDDGTITWTSPGGGHYPRRPKRTPPPPILPGTTLPPLLDDG